MVSRRINHRTYNIRVWGRKGRRDDEGNATYACRSTGRGLGQGGLKSHVKRDIFKLK